ncbi:cyclase family protein [Paenibacillus sp. UMB4589-SE434]|uniref:cyclase family protein n=1 Tax=Paenibacillus sp. UMB4589-SE434 TaxID=3046314 RepID=UPI00254B9234|nr:cyclase family protein [Paenibacillus sp. UMB4589-SE434]MDK8183820.1 cyclase family protein [Paenibacillus sp. UMB4589-SE434]
MFKIYDISMTIQDGMQVYKNKDEKKPVIRNVQNFSNAKAYESRIDIDVHCGTHVDAPLHMLENGDTIESIGLDQLVGHARVLDLTHLQDSIGREDLEPFGLQRGDWVLFKTRNSSSEEFDFEFVFLNETGAEYLIELGVKGVGTDGLGIERAQPNYTTHRPLFQNDIIIVEGLRLKEVEQGTYFMVIAPLKLTGIEAAPARAFLIGS